MVESVEVYPAGRGKILAIIKKKMPTKPKEYKNKQPRYLHAKLKANPEDISIVEYLDSNSGNKHIYLFPFGLELSYEQRKDLALSLLSTLYSVNKDEIRITAQIRRELKAKWKKYLRWRRRVQR